MEPILLIAAMGLTSYELGIPRKGSKNPLTAALALTSAALIWHWHADALIAAAGRGAGFVTAAIAWAWN